MNFNLKTPIKHIQRGFTLVELLVVVAVIAIISVVAISLFGSAKTKENI